MKGTHKILKSDSKLSSSVMSLTVKKVKSKKKI